MDQNEYFIYGRYVKSIASKRETNELLTFDDFLHLSFIECMKAVVARGPDSGS